MTHVKLQLRMYNLYNEESSDKAKVGMSNILLKLGREVKVNVIKNKDRLWKHSRLKEAEEQWQLNVTTDVRASTKVEDHYKGYYWVKRQMETLMADSTKLFYWC